VSHRIEFEGAALGECVLNGKVECLRRKCRDKPARELGGDLRKYRYLKAALTCAGRSCTSPLKGEVAPNHSGPDIEHIIGDVVTWSHAI
jgi:hypothetical protein